MSKKPSLSAGFFYVPRKVFGSKIAVIAALIHHQSAFNGLTSYPNLATFMLMIVIIIQSLSLYRFIALSLYRFIALSLYRFTALPLYRFTEVSGVSLGSPYRDK
ncbi:MAG: hypothetical protein ABNH02_11160 [Pseudomonadales bacterium]|jgi:hypothetical protein